MAYNFEIHSVIKSYSGNGIFVYDLSNGEEIRGSGDGTATSADGDMYTEILRGVGQPEIIDGEECYDRYESLGWALNRDM